MCVIPVSGIASGNVEEFLNVASFSSASDELFGSVSLLASVLSEPNVPVFFF